MASCHREPSKKLIACPILASRSFRDVEQGLAAEIDASYGPVAPPSVVSCLLHSSSRQAIMRCVLVSCCGLPAAGKTTFCRRVATDQVTMPAAFWTSTAAPAPHGAQPETLDANRERVTQIRVSHVCFDDYVERAGRRRPSDSENTRTIPRPALTTGDASVEANRAAEMTPGAELAAGSGDSARFWHDGRQAALADIDVLASTQDATAMASTVEASQYSAERRQSSLSSEAAPEVHVVLADDNMHFRTMRHEVFSLARRYGCGYAQVYFPTDVELAVARNQTRGTPVAEAVIRKMAANIQPPDPKRFKWERYTAVVGGAEGSSSWNPSGRRGGELQVGDGAGREMGVWDDSGVQQSFWRVIAAAAAAEDMMVPASPASSAASLLQQEADREATRDSLLHQFDLELREAVKRVAEKAADARLSSDVLRKVMQACSTSRKNALRRAKTAANQNRAREADQSDSASLAANHNTEGGGAGGGSAPVFPPRLPHLEQFVVEFEAVVSNVHGVGMPIRQSLLHAARAS